LELSTGAGVGETTGAGVTGARVGEFTGAKVGEFIGAEVGAGLSGHLPQAAGQSFFTLSPSFVFFLHRFLAFFPAHLQDLFLFLILNLSFFLSLHAVDVFSTIGAADATPRIMAIARIKWESLMVCVFFLRCVFVR